VCRPFPEQEGPRTHTFKLERLDGTPADPPSDRTTVYRWSPGDRIPIKPGRTLQVVRVRRNSRRGRGCLDRQPSSQRRRRSGYPPPLLTRPRVDGGNPRPATSRRRAGRGSLRVRCTRRILRSSRGNRSFGASLRRRGVSRLRPRRRRPNPTTGCGSAATSPLSERSQSFCPLRASIAESSRRKASG
jgi:hypothetical protein